MGSAAWFGVVPGRAFEDDRLDVYDIAILAALGWHTDKNGQCYPSFATIAKESKATRRAVITHVQKLVTLGYLSKESRQTNRGGASSNRYTIITYSPPDAAETSPSEADSLPRSAPDAPELSHSSERTQLKQKSTATPPKEGVVAVVGGTKSTPKVARKTWLTKPLADWREVMGGEIPPGKLAKALQPVRKALLVGMTVPDPMIADAETAKRFHCFLQHFKRDRKLEYATPFRFAEIHGQYAAGIPPARQNGYGHEDDDYDPLAHTDDWYGCGKCGHTHRVPHGQPKVCTGENL